MAADARYANPYYWAGYLLTGAGTQEAADPSVSVVTGRFAREARAAGLAAVTETATPRCEP